MGIRAEAQQAYEKAKRENNIASFSNKQKGCSIGVPPFRSMFKLFSIVNEFPKMEKLFTILNSFLIFGKLFSIMNKKR